MLNQLVGNRARVGRVFAISPPDAFGNALGQSFVGMMQPTDNRALLNAANRASDPEYYGSQVDTPAPWSGSGLRLSAEQASQWGPQFNLDPEPISADYSLGSGKLGRIDASVAAEGGNGFAPTMSEADAIDLRATLGLKDDPYARYPGVQLAAGNGYVLDTPLFGAPGRITSLPRTPQEAAALLAGMPPRSALEEFSERAQSDSRPSMKASDGVVGDPYAKARTNLAMAFAGPPVAAAVLIPATSSAVSGLGVLSSTVTVGPWGTAGLGFVTSGGMDAAMQYYEKGGVDRPMQSLFAGTIGAVSGPLGATSGLWTNIVVGGAGGALNTQFQNTWYGEDKSLGLPTVMSGAFGGIGFYGGALTTKAVSFFKPETYYRNLDPNMPALFQPMVVNQVPQIFGVTMGGVASGIAPLGENLYKDFTAPAPKKP